MIDRHSRRASIHLPSHVFLDSPAAPGTRLRGLLDRFPAQVLLGLLPRGFLPHPAVLLLPSQALGLPSPALGLLPLLLLGPLPPRLPPRLLALLVLEQGLREPPVRLLLEAPGGLLRRPLLLRLLVLDVDAAAEVLRVPPEGVVLVARELLVPLHLVLEAELEAALHAPHDRLRVPRLVDLARVAAVRAPDEVRRFVDGATEREDVVSE